MDVVGRHETCFMCGGRVNGRASGPGCGKPTSEDEMTASTDSSIRSTARQRRDQARVRLTSRAARAAAGALLALAALLALPAHAQTTVDADWGGIPAGVAAGTPFRLLFVTSTGIACTSTDISTYNSFVQGLLVHTHRPQRPQRPFQGGREHVRGGCEGQHGKQRLDGSPSIGWAAPRRRTTMAISTTTGPWTPTPARPRLGAPWGVVASPGSGPDPKTTEPRLKMFTRIRHTSVRMTCAGTDCCKAVAS